MLKQLSFLIIQAGHEIKNIYEKKNSLNIFYKIDQSFVTNADYISEKIIIKGLKRLTPNIPILSEENNLDIQDCISCSKYWLIDPLDGTKDFINNYYEFTVNIALIEKGIPVLGFIYAPMYNTLYYTWEGISWKEKDGIKKKIMVIDQNPPTIAISRFHNDIELNKYISTINNAKIIKLGSALKFCLLAEGKIQLYPRFGRTAIWDIAAGHAIISAAGGFLRSMIPEKKIDYIISSKKSIFNPGFIASVL
ncbi:3'(2'),5'-bisphosphate nucleotidase CysQ [Buchnera aphidicola (Eriosoma grossulariae)]|uniref:3'(2'),5'-bisphosphate nucleotidase CysQ n=1 Tax=Buchnera aphidicola TaxID=9 RepID=UPI003464168A